MKGSNFLTTLLITGASAAIWPEQTFKSTPITAPYLNVTKNGKTEVGNLFFSPSTETKSNPSIFSDDGQLVWQGPMANTSAMQPQMLNGKPVIAYWQGADLQGFGFGHISIVNTSYDEIHHITLPSTKEHPFSTIMDPETFPSYIDIHESQITDEGTILVTAVNITQMDLSSIGGPKDGWVQDGLFYEIDIKSNDVLFRWSTVEHIDQIPLNNSELPFQGKGESKTQPYEYPHLNSVAKYGDNYLLSSRFMCSVFFIEKNGDVIWHLHGQKTATFKHTSPSTTFCYQHDPRFITPPTNTSDTVTLHLHDNANADFTSHTSITTGLTLTLNQSSNEVSLDRKLWDAEEPIFSESQGNFQALENGHVLLQHGGTPKIEEYDENGALVMRARFGFDNGDGGVAQSYRAYRFRGWTGKPRTKPAVKACSGESGEEKVVVYVSWNGATDVGSWKVRVGSGESEGGLKVARTVPCNGFETRVDLGVMQGAKKVMVEAVGGVGGGMKSEVVEVEQSCD